MEHTFEVEGAVVGKQRHRYSARSGYVRAYTPGKTTSYEKAVRDAYEASGGPMFDGPVSMRIDTHRMLPKSRPKRVESEPDTMKPDFDNIAKIVADGLNGVAYKDDCQIVEGIVVKHPRERIANEYISVTLRSVEYDSKAD